MLSKLMVELCRFSYKEDFEKCLLRKNIKFKNICAKYNIKADNIICIRNSHITTSIIETKNCCIVVFKGTDDIFDLMADIDFFPKKTPIGTVHRGFYNAFFKIYFRLKEHLDLTKKKIFLTGHSLGAALAVLCSAYFKHRNPTLVTFGSPRVGAKNFIDYVSKDVLHIRWENVNDIVCYSPLMFEHFGEKRSILFGTPFSKSHGSKYYKRMVCAKFLDYCEHEDVINKLNKFY
jgi:predicted lipase